MRGCQGASFGGVISGSCVESTRDSRVLIKGQWWYMSLGVVLEGRGKRSKRDKGEGYVY